MKAKCPFIFFIIYITLAGTVSALTRQKRVERAGPDGLRSPFQPPDEKGNTLNFEENHLSSIIETLGPQKSPFSPPGNSNNGYKNVIPTQRHIAKEKPKHHQTNPKRVPTEKAFQPPQNLKKAPTRNVFKPATARESNPVSPFRPPSGKSAVPEAPQASPEKTHRTQHHASSKSRTKGPKRKPSPSRLEHIVARQHENSHEIPPISDIHVKPRHTEPLPKPVPIRGRHHRGRPRLTPFQDNRPRHRDIHDVSPGVTPWTRYTARPRTLSDTQEERRPSAVKGRCGTARYSPRNEICCQGTVNRRQGREPSCCGHVNYDAVFKKCCAGKVVLRTAQQPGCDGTLK